MSRTAESRPSFSVIIPTHNRWPLVSGAIESVLRQTYRSFEVIVVDDGSTDGTRQHVERRFPEVRVISQPNRERGAARNAGVRQSRGRFLAFLDSDDLFEPHHLEVITAAGAKTVATSALMWNPASDRVWPHKSSISREPLTLDAALWGNPVPICCLVTERSSFEAVGGFPEDRNMAGSEDWVFVVRLAARGGILRLPEPTCRIRHHPGRSMADSHEMIAARQAAALLILQEKIGDRQLDESMARIVQSGTDRFCAAHHYEAGRMKAARANLRRLQRHLGIRESLPLVWPLWFQTLMGRRGSLLLRTVRDRLFH